MLSCFHITRRSLTAICCQNLRREDEQLFQKKRLKFLDFDEAHFGLIYWHKKRYCPKGFRPPYIMQRACEWTYLYTAVDPATGERLCLYLPGLDGTRIEAFLERLSEVYADHRLVLVLDNAPSHISKEIEQSQNVELLPMPAYSPELNPVERWCSGV